MRVLYAWRAGKYSRAARVSINFYGRLREHCDLVIYGSKAHYPIFSSYDSYPFRDRIVLQELVNETMADVVLLGGGGSLNYFRGSLRCNVPVVLLLNEYITLPEKFRKKIKKLSGYFDLSIARVQPGLRDFGPPSVWLPFSASEEFYTEYNSDDIDRRDRKIVYRGTERGQPPYTVRKKAIGLLEESGLLAPRASRKHATSFRRYPSHLKSYIGGLSCAWGSWGQTPLKAFEILASGTVLLTQQFRPEVVERLFGTDRKYYVAYKDDCSDVVGKAKRIVDDVDRSKRLVRDALEMVNGRHLDGHRVRELYGILEALVGGRDIPRKWG